MRSIPSERSIIVLSWFFLCLLEFNPELARARDVLLDESQQIVCVEPGEPTQISFPIGVVGATRHLYSLAVERKDEYLILFALPAIPEEGERLPVSLKDGTKHNFLVVPRSSCDPRDEFIRASY